MEADYRLWRQYDENWNQIEAWPEKDFPYAKLRYMRSGGCFITSMAIMLRMYGIEQEADPQLFNPLILCLKMQKIGAYSQYAYVIPEHFSRLYPIDYLGSVPFSSDKLDEYMEKKLPCLIMVPGELEPYHYVVPDTKEGNRIKICDPGWAKEYLDEFPKQYYIVLFRKRGFASDYTVKYLNGSIDVDESTTPGDATDINIKRDILVGAMDRWKEETPIFLGGRYAASLRNAAERRLYLLKSQEESPEFLFYQCKDGKLLYGSREYILSQNEYREESEPDRICRISPGECIVYDEIEKRIIL